MYPLYRDLRAWHIDVLKAAVRSKLYEPITTYVQNPDGIIVIGAEDLPKPDPKPVQKVKQ